MIIIYTLKDPFTNVIRYVGKTTEKNFHKRFISHNNPHSRKDGNPHKINWINSIKKKGGKVIMEVLDTIEGDWEWLERYWIAQFKEWGFPLVNYSKGGDNPPIRTFQKEESKLKMKLSRKDRRKVKVIDYKTKEVIGIWDGVNDFIREYLKYDRYEDKKKFKLWSSKISQIANKRKDRGFLRKSCHGLTFEYL
tara:strand:- start:1301 stop:1879 length:579 start_codon:yes stop_codon:yes gene_type:complete